AGAQIKPKPSPTPPPAPRAGASPLAVQGAQQQGNTDSVRRIERDEALKLFRKGEAVLVDVRSNQQFSLGHINGAVNIPGSQLLSRIGELPPKKLIITYCA
ncbi:MAG TPA: rhodanese-like domain-containing protein, partial [Thermoanaerobaculia bacterium]|nr:rhodanese-like domain-containing protein [Thermoanaerobaculia bacterium]